MTAVVGATLAANLGLIALDIAEPAMADAAVPGSGMGEKAIPRPA